MAKAGAAGDEGERVALRQAPDPVHGAVEERDAAARPFGVECGLPACAVGDRRLVGRPAGAHEGRPDGLAVVEGEVRRPVLGFGDDDAGLGQGVAERLEVEMLVVDEDSVEVEEDGGGHQAP